MAQNTQGGGRSRAHGSRLYKVRTHGPLCLRDVCGCCVWKGLKARLELRTAIVAPSRPPVVVALPVLTAVLVGRLALGSSVPWSGWPGWAVLAGLCGATALVAFYAALATGTMGVVAPIASMSVAVPVLLGVATGDALTALMWAGIGVLRRLMELTVARSGGSNGCGTAQ